jgi:hypothetical protein
MHGKTRKAVCEKVANDIMRREALYIANLIAKSEIKEEVQYEYLFGFADGFALALNMILSGKLDLQEIHKEYPDSDQAYEKGGPDGFG